MAKKFVVAMMMHETNTFSPLPTPIASFARATDLAGPLAIKESEGTNTSLGGFIEVARKAGAEFTVPMAASANPSGLVTKAAYEQMTAAIVDEVKKGCDAVLCGHIHTPIISQRNGVRYLNSGDWVESCSAIVEYADGSFELIQRPTHSDELQPVASETGFFGESTPFAETWGRDPSTERILEVPLV